MQKAKAAVVINGYSENFNTIHTITFCEILCRNHTFCIKNLSDKMIFSCGLLAGKFRHWYSWDTWSMMGKCLHTIKSVG